MINKITYRSGSKYAVSLVLATVLTVILGGPTAMAQRADPVRVPANRSARLNVQYHRAETAWKNGHSLLEAKARIDRVLNEIPRDAEARKLRAGIFMSMGEANNALVDARTATEIHPDDGEAFLLLCEACVRAGAFEEATRALYRSADLLLDQSKYHIRLSRCAVSLGQYDAAEAYARTALAGQDRDADAYLQLARVFVIRDDAEKAVTVLDRGIDANVLNILTIRQDSILSPLVNDLEHDRRR